ncbi:MAG TPA: PAS domain-containing sensor histidine kinase [Verrucomicrobiae bacterium]|nr:PAS domain-containing sensor histidine kinase [Verrucomicrobiae bacterium]
MDASAMHGKQKPQENKISREREWLRSLIDSMADGVIAVDSQYKVVLYNAAALLLLDRNGNVTGRSLGQVLKLYNKDGDSVNVSELVGHTETATISRDFLLYYGDGSKANLYLSVAPVHFGYDTSHNRGYVLLLRDITREKSLEEERDEFISVVSHELRTPLAIAEGNISNALLIAKQTGHIPNIQEALDAAYRQVLFLSGLVNDLSTLSRAERGALKTDVEAVNPHQLVEDLAAGYRGQVAAKGLTLKVDLDPSLEILHSSSLYIREILHNFITNAIKYTQEGSVTIAAHATVDGVRFSVHDTGIGMSRPDQQKIFTKFFRSEDYRTRASSGTGLGLYITQKLAMLLHADISATSELNQGSTFTLTVPNLPH